MHNSTTIQPKEVVIRRRPNQGFGFTLRHFIAYPPEDEDSWPQSSASYQRKPMETIFIKEVQSSGPANFSGLQMGDRVLMVNNIPIAGISYSAIVTMIKQTPSVLKLHVVPKECDILQMRYDIAHTPESNRLSKPTPVVLPLTTTGQAAMHQQKMISYPIDSVRNMQKRINDDYSEINPGSLTLRDTGLLRSKPSNLTVLPKPNVADNDFMIRLRKSIEQKEEFLKSPVPHTQSAFFQHNSNASTLLNSSSSSTSSAQGASSYTSASARGQVSTLLKPISRDLLPASCDMNNFCAKNLPPAFHDTFLTRYSRGGEVLQRNNQRYSRNSSLGAGEIGSSTIKDKFHKELEFLESLPEMGVTNQVFERKLESHLTKSFDPFKPLSINTTSNNIAKQTKIFEGSLVEAQAKGRMELHKANVAATTLEEYQLTKSSLKSEEGAEPIEEEPQNVEIVSATTLAAQKSTEVVRRYKPIVIDDNKPMRRISYLRATNNENEYQIETPAKVNNSEENNKRTSVQNEIRESVHLEEVPEVNGKVEIKELPIETEILETEMEIKSSCINGKRISEYRSWRQVKIEVKGDILKIYPGRSSKSDNNVIELDVKNFNILDESVDKKKHVFRLQSKPRSVSEAATTASNNELAHDAAANEVSNNSDRLLNHNEYTEILFKTKSITEMRKLFGLLQDKCGSPVNSENDNHGKQLAEPQKTVAMASMPTNTFCDDIVQEYSPQSSTSRGDLEQESISPVMKTRKSHKNIPDKDLGSPKTKNWKDLLFRRSHTNNADISPSNLSSSSKTIGSIGVPLRSCPMSKDNEFVPHIVDVCTNIVETKGLTVTGIYRIPGNKAAISELKEQVNKSDFTWDKCNTDVRWEDVNVVSSLLKLFIRSLPDALLPSTFYINFIEADKKTDDRRIKELKYLLKALPTYSYETLKHIIRHLNRVSKNCDLNLMEPKNLAIIFGPSIIRTPNETLEIAVKDMKHQCRIVELLVTQYDYFFEDGELPELDMNTLMTTSTSSSSHQDQTSLLLHNVSKIERLNDRESLTSRLIPHLRRRTHSKRSAVSSDTYSGESVLSLDFKKSPEAPLKQNIVKVHKERNSSVEISILLTDEESSNSRISDSGKDDEIESELNYISDIHFSGSMSLTTITDTLDSKLRNLRSGSESNDENGSPNTNSNVQCTNRRNTFQQPFVLHENIPYADESPERPAIPADNGGGGVSVMSVGVPQFGLKNATAQRNSSFNRDLSRNPRFSSVCESCSDDSEVSTTSDPKESLIITPLFLEKYKKRRDYRLFRSASFNCRNYSSRGGGGGGNNTISSGVGVGGSNCNNSTLTKDEKTDMNLTKKRQIQNKQNRSIKRRHTVGGPHDYSTTVTRRSAPTANGNGNNNFINNNEQVVEVGIRIKNVNRRN